MRAAASLVQQAEQPGDALRQEITLPGVYLMLYELNEDAPVVNHSGE